MTRILVLFYLSIHLITSTELSQFLKVPVLVNHFIEHKEQDASMSFIDYLIHHYGGHEQDEDWETDMKLPFMKHVEIVHFIFDIQKSFFLISEHFVLSLVQKADFTSGAAFSTTESLSAIFQPPRA